MTNLNGEISSNSSSYQENLYDAIANEKQYFNLLKAADEQTFKDQFEAEILLLLDEAQIKAYSRHSPLAERKCFIEYFGRAQNPNPLLPQNDRLLAHLIRRAYARGNFPYREPPYFDDRGKYFIKYGKPMFRYQELAGRRHIGSLVNIRQNSYSVKANES